MTSSPTCLFSSTVVAAAIALFLRLIQVLRATHTRKPSEGPCSVRPPTCRTAVLLGSGGHTGEMIRLMAGLPFDRYSPRIYIISSGDALSKSKAIELERAKQAGQYSFLEIPRARNVHQSFLTAPFSTLYSLLFCCWFIAIRPIFVSRSHPSRRFSKLVLLNGPGSSVPIALAAFLPRLVTGDPTPRLVYVESLARVKRLSLSGRLLLPFMDNFVVQWDILAKEVEQSRIYQTLRRFRLVPSVYCDGWMV